MMTEKYYTWINFVCIFVLSLGIYFLYIWASNYTGFSSTFYSMEVIFTTPHYYLTFGICTVFCYVIDLFIESYFFNFRQSPVDFLRRMVSSKQSILNHKDEFN
jgi:hypothetical protein